MSCVQPVDPISKLDQLFFGSLPQGEEFILLPALDNFLEKYKHFSPVDIVHDFPNISLAYVNYYSHERYTQHSKEYKQEIRTMFSIIIIYLISYSTELVSTPDSRNNLMIEYQQYNSYYFQNLDEIEITKLDYFRFHAKRLFEEGYSLKNNSYPILTLLNRLTDITQTSGSKESVVITRRRLILNYEHEKAVIFNINFQIWCDQLAYFIEDNVDEEREEDL